MPISRPVGRAAVRVRNGSAVLGCLALFSTLLLVAPPPAAAEVDPRRLEAELDETKSALRETRQELAATREALQALTRKVDGLEASQPNTFGTRRGGNRPPRARERQQPCPQPGRRHPRLLELEGRPHGEHREPRGRLRPAERGTLRERPDRPLPARIRRDRRQQPGGPRRRGGRARHDVAALESHRQGRALLRRRGPLCELPPGSVALRRPPTFDRPDGGGRVQGGGRRDLVAGTAAHLRPAHSRRLQRRRRGAASRIRMPSASRSPRDRSAR